MVIERLSQRARADSATRGDTPTGSLNEGARAHKQVVRWGPCAWADQVSATWAKIAATCWAAWRRVSCAVRGPGGGRVPCTRRASA